ncbi:MAG: hypothetical protein B6I29_04070 [Marinitoga sp. 4572_148]|nr:MAG: hypothetical protein B6I29_04070 [Marinitoga sp. 4572_148]
MYTFDFLKKVKEINTLIQVIITTANSSYSNILNAIKNGADDYLIKPFFRVFVSFRLFRQSII